LVSTEKGTLEIRALTVPYHSKRMKKDEDIRKRPEAVDMAARNTGMGSSSSTPSMNLRLRG
jgi:hypothetical protein